MWKTLDDTIVYNLGSINNQGICQEQNDEVLDSMYVMLPEVFRTNRACMHLETSALCDATLQVTRPATVPTIASESTELSELHHLYLPFAGLEQNRSDRWNENFYVRCPSGHLTHGFLACDHLSACWARGDSHTSLSCRAPMTPLPPAMTCDDGVQVPYTLVCDHQPHCYDNSDEEFCVYNVCDILTQFQCSDRECLPRELKCDGVAHCTDAGDEKTCTKKRTNAFDKSISHHVPLPVMLTFEHHGKTKLRSLRRWVSVNGVAMNKTLVNARLVNVTLVSQTLVRGSLANRTVVRGFLINGTLVSGLLLNGSLENNGTEMYDTLSSGTSVSGLLVGGTLDTKEADAAARSMSRIQVSGMAMVNVTLVSAILFCPDTHFRCADVELCLPVFTRCNGMFDCPGHEDEAQCDSYQCPGFYRCRGARMCVHRLNMCDGLFHCPQYDDEMCFSTCPPGCTCYGFAFFCFHNPPVKLNARLRFLDASDSGMDVGDLQNNTMLISLRLLRCNIRDCDPVLLPNLRSLDLSSNNITKISTHFIKHLPNLLHLKLAFNPLDTTFQPEMTSSKYMFPKVRSLDLSGVLLPELEEDVLSIFPSLNVLNMTGSGLERVFGKGFQQLPQLRVVDLRGCPLTFFPRDMFQTLDQLMSVHADNYKLCCSAVLPVGFNLVNCKASFDEISSCEDLLRSDVLRICLYIFAILSCVGNLVGLVFRMKSNKNKRRTGFDTFVANLCVSDFLMGVYLSILGVADRVYHKVYMWNDVTWRHSFHCSAAGFLSLLSSEISAFTICLITLDRFLVLRFPFSQLRFSPLTAFIASSFVWLMCLVLAALPLLPCMSHWNFYSQTGICIPLPITRIDFEGRLYSFSIMIVLNFALFVVIALGQVAIFTSVQKHKLTMDSGNARNKDQTLARRLIGVALSDFFCWFPIGLTGLMADKGFPIPGSVNVAMAVFVVPLNSAINPFLYTLNLVLEKRRQLHESRLKQFLMAQMKIQHASTNDIVRFGNDCIQHEAEKLFKLFLRRGILTDEHVALLLQENTTPSPDLKTI